MPVEVQRTPGATTFGGMPVQLSAACAVCGGSRFRDLFTIQEIAFRYVMGRCFSCGHVQAVRSETPLRTKPDQEDWFENPAGAGVPASNDPEAWRRIDRFWGSRRTRSFASIVRTLSRIGYSQGRLVDIGCSFGHFLAYARDCGYAVLGVDPSARARRLALERLDVTVVPDVPAIPSGFRRSDIVTCAETLYCVLDVNAFLQQLRPLLRPGGCLVLKNRCNRTSIFRLAALAARMRSRELVVTPRSPLWGWSLRGFHLFTTQELCRLLRDNGFDIRLIRNEKQIWSWSWPGIPTLGLKLGMVAASSAASFVSFGRIKIGTEVTIYAVRS